MTETPKRKVYIVGLCRICGGDTSPTGKGNEWKCASCGNLSYED